MTATNLLEVVAARHKGDAAALRAPRADAWGAAATVTVPLEPTPLDAQPSSYVQRAWTGRPYGTAKSVELRAAVAGDSLHIRLEWAAPEPVRSITDNDVFPDACGVLFPTDGRDAELSTMGSDEHPVQGWHWRSGAPQAYTIVARGLGTVERLDTHQLVADAEWADGTWAVVFARPLSAPGVDFGAGVPMGCAIWTGAAGERAGLAAHTPEWLRLRIE